MVIIVEKIAVPSSSIELVRRLCPLNRKSYGTKYSIHDYSSCWKRFAERNEVWLYLFSILSTSLSVRGRDRL